MPAKDQQYFGPMPEQGGYFAPMPEAALSPQGAVSSSALLAELEAALLNIRTRMLAHVADEDDETWMHLADARAALKLAIDSERRHSANA